MEELINLVQVFDFGRFLFFFDPTLILKLELVSYRILHPSLSFLLLEEVLLWTKYVIDRIEVNVEFWLAP